MGSKPTPILFEGGRTFTRAEKQVLCRFFFESHPWSLVWPNSGFWCCVFLTLWITPLDQVQAKILCPSFIPMHILFTMGRANKGKTGTCIHKSINIPKSISSKAPSLFTHATFKKPIGICKHLPCHPFQSSYPGPIVIVFGLEHLHRCSVYFTLKNKIKCPSWAVCWAVFLFLATPPIKL